MMNKYDEMQLFKQLDLIKQELIQAENKIGWSSAFFAIMISVLVLIGNQTNQWIIIGIGISFPILSLLVLVIALVPSIKLLPKRIISKKDRMNLMKISIFGYEKVHENTNVETSLIASVDLFAKLAFKKYKLIKIAFWISFFPILILAKIVTWIWNCKFQSDK